MGLFSEDKPEGCVRCTIVVGNVPQSGSLRAGMTLMFGLVGLAASSGHKEDKVRGCVFIKPRGLRIVPDKEVYLEIRIPWEDIVHVGIDDKISVKYLHIFTNSEANIKLVLESGGKSLKDKIIQYSPNLIKYDDEGWV